MPNRTTGLEIVHNHQLLETSKKKWTKLSKGTIKLKKWQIKNRQCQ